jgi:cytochrome c biogenesis protein CcmG/thiol:disulfide interchange protein DsbE
MRQYVLFVILFLLIAAPSNAISISIGERAPDFTLRSVSGESVVSRDFKGKTLALIFWRTEQKRSVMALKEAADIMKAYGQKGVQVISIIEDSESIEEAQNVLKDNKIQFPMLIDVDRQVYGAYGIRVFPTTVIIDKDGMLAYDIPSHPLSYKIKLEGYVRKLIGEINEDELKAVLSPKRERKDDALLEAERKYNLAMKFVQMRMMDQAIAAAKQTVEAKPDVAKSHILLGFLYLNSDDADNALKAFDNALELEPGSNDAKTGKGGALVAKGEADRAIAILTEAAVANPYAQMTYYELGKAYELKGDKEKAVELYKMAIEKIVEKRILPSFVSGCR